MRALALIALAGCAADGVFVEVDTRTIDGVVSVELVISKTVCQDPRRDGDCRSIQGQGFTSPVGAPGDLFTRDGSAITQSFDAVPFSTKSSRASSLFQSPRGTCCRSP
jgi:hypothetical protein